MAYHTERRFHGYDPVDKKPKPSPDSGVPANSMELAAWRANARRKETLRLGRTGVPVKPQYRPSVVHCIRCGRPMLGPPGAFHPTLEGCPQD